MRFHDDADDDDDEAKASSLREDRVTRVPSLLQTAKNVNSHILGLQEVEGGSSGFGDDDESLLETPQNVLVADDHNDNSTTTMTKGYDECLWTPLHPQRVDDDDVVGLAVAW